LLDERGEAFGGTEIALVNDPGLPLHASALDQIVVELVALSLGDNRTHTG
jgi:hypothetical protein